MPSKSVSIVDLAAKGQLSDFFHAADTVGAELPSSDRGPRHPPQAALFGCLAILMDRGLNLARSLKRLADTAYSEDDRLLCEAILKDLEVGCSLLEAANNTRCFTHRQLGWLAIAEATGDLERVLPFLYRHEWMSQEAQSKVLAGSVDLLVAVCLAGLVFTNPWVLLIVTGIVVLLVYRLRRACADPKVLLQVFQHLLKAPLLGQIIKDWLTVEFISALSVQLEGGVRFSLALPLAGNVLGPTMGDGLADRTTEAFFEGESLMASLRSTGFFPPMALSFISCAEETGSVPRVVNWLARDAEARFHASTQALLDWLRAVSLLTFAVSLTALLLVPPHKIAQLQASGAIGECLKTLPRVVQAEVPVAVETPKPTASPKTKATPKPTPKPTRKAPSPQPTKANR